MARLSLLFLIGTAMIGVIGMAKFGSADGSGAPATIDVDVLIKLLGDQVNINIKLFLDLIQKISANGCLTADVVGSLVKASCSSTTGDGIISVQILISLLNILKLVGTLLNGTVINISLLIKIIITVIIGPTC